MEDLGLIKDDDLQEPVKQSYNRNIGRWVKGQSGNPKGRPPGKTLKEYTRDYLAKMTDEERDAFLDGLPKDVIWKMAEGQPHFTTDITSGGKPIPLLANINVPNNDSNQEDNPVEEKD